MQTAKNVIWTETAKKDLYNIHQRLKARSEQRAKDVSTAVLKVTATLNTAFATGTPEPLLRNEKEEHRFVVAGFYKIIYSITLDQVIIKTIYHQRQDAVVG